MAIRYEPQTLTFGFWLFRLGNTFAVLMSRVKEHLNQYSARIDFRLGRGCESLMLFTDPKGLVAWDGETPDRVQLIVKRVLVIPLVASSIPENRAVTESWG